jgi:DNA-binding response OmpR family regulator
MGLFSKERILVVEDSESLSKAVLFKLKASGFKVINAWLDHWLHGKRTGLDVLQYIK